MPRATSPTCLFWDVSTPEAQWSSEGLNSVIMDVSSGEIKQFRVNCTSDHLTAFAVGVNVITSVSCIRSFNTEPCYLLIFEQDFEFTIPVYIGCGFIIFQFCYVYFFPSSFLVRDQQQCLMFICDDNYVVLQYV